MRIRARISTTVRKRCTVGLAVALTATALAGCGNAGKISTESDRNGCAVTALPESTGDSYSRAERVSASGEYVAGHDRAENVVLWHDTDRDVVMKDAGIVQIGGVTAKGTVAVAETSESSSVFDDGEQTRLANEADLSVVTDMNESGEVIGYATLVDDVVAESPLYPLRWEAGSTEPVALDVKDGDWASAEVVTDDGTALGYQQPEGESSRAVPWRWETDGDGEQLPLLPIAEEKSALPIDASGDWVVSTGMDGVGGYRWKLSDPDSATKLDDDLIVTSIDSRGRVYGSLSEGDGFGAPVMQDGDEVVELPILRGTAEKPRGLVFDASRDGSVLVGSSTLDHNHRNDFDIEHAVTWTCR